MAKSLAQQIRETMDRLAEAQEYLPYDFEMDEVENWLEPGPDVDPDTQDESVWPSYLPIRVEYSIYGQDRPARIRYDDDDYPAEHAQIDQYRVLYAGQQPLSTSAGMLQPGQEIKNVPQSVDEEIEQAIWQDVERMKQDNDYDPPDDYYDRRY